MKEILINSLKLCIITLVAGLLLSATYEITLKPRQKQEEKAKQEAYAKVFDTAESFQEYEYDKKAMEKYLEENGYKSTVGCIDEVVEAVDKDKQSLGYVLTVTDKEGYGGKIQFTIGITKEGVINGISFLTLSETAGVGMKAADSKFKNQFNGKKAEVLVNSTTGATKENEIDAISGATITSNAVTNGVNIGILGYQYITSSDGKGGESNE